MSFAPILESRALPEVTLAASVPVMVLARHRAALAAGDAEGVRATLASGPRPPTERDLLVDLMAAVGLPTAVRRLKSFWSRTEVSVESVRELEGGQLEVYERLTLPGGDHSAHAMTLLRRTDDGWRVVCSDAAPCGELRGMVLSPSDSAELSDVAFSRSFIERFGPTAELVMDEGEGVLNHPSEDWMGRVVGPISGDQLGPTLAGTSASTQHPQRALEVSLEPALDTRERYRQLSWIGRALGMLSLSFGPSAVFLPAADKLLAAEKLLTQQGPALHRSLAASWVRLSTRDGFGHTRGLTHFAAPEIEVGLEDWGDVASAIRLAVRASVALIEHAFHPVVGTVLQIGKQRCRIEAGRRGPAPGHSYGRWGSIVLRPVHAHARLSDSGMHPLVKT